MAKAINDNTRWALEEILNKDKQNKIAGGTGIDPYTKDRLIYNTLSVDADQKTKEKIASMEAQSKYLSQLSSQASNEKNVQKAIDQRNDQQTMQSLGSIAKLGYQEAVKGGAFGEKGRGLFDVITGKPTTNSIIDKGITKMATDNYTTLGSGIPEAEAAIQSASTVTNGLTTASSLGEIGTTTAFETAGGVAGGVGTEVATQAAMTGAETAGVTAATSSATSAIPIVGWAIGVRNLLGSLFPNSFLAGDVVSDVTNLANESGSPFQSQGNLWGSGLWANSGSFIGGEAEQSFLQLGNNVYNAVGETGAQALDPIGAIITGNTSSLLDNWLSAGGLF